MNRQREIQEKYDHALDRIYGLFKVGREKEQELESKIDLVRDELVRIANLCASNINESKEAAILK